MPSREVNRKTTGPLTGCAVLWIMPKEGSPHTQAGLPHHTPDAPLIHLQSQLSSLTPVVSSFWWRVWKGNPPFMNNEHLEQIKTISKEMSLVYKYTQAPESCSFSSILLARHKLENSCSIVKLLHTLYQRFNMENRIVYSDVYCSTAILLGEIPV